MIFRSLTLNDFGTYAGRHRLDLSPEPDRPVVLIGGSNGAGKTTILEALLLCLHGRRALGTAVSLKEYDRHVGSRIHVPPEGADAPREASLALVLEHTEAGKPSEYLVERTWTRTRAGRVRERFFLARDGAPVDDLPESSWQDFLDGLIPPGIANLFLFDGERIQALAEDDTGEQLGDAVRRLLGLDVVGQLRTDLTRYAAKVADQTPDQLGELFVEREREVREAEAGVRALQEKREEVKSGRDQVAGRAERQRERFAQQGGVLAKERAKLETRARAATGRAATAEAEVREMVAGLLPFAICPQLATRVETRLESEQLDEENEIIRRRLRDVKAKLSRRLALRSGSGPLFRAIEEIMLSADSGDSSLDRVHDLTPTDRAVLAEQLGRVRSTLPTAANAAAKRLSRAAEERTRIEEVLGKVPEASMVTELLVRLQRLEREVGALDAELDRLDDDLNRAKYAVTVADRELRRAKEALQASHDVDHRSGLALRTVGALEAFEGRLQTRKLSTVELETARYFNRLSRKGGLLSTVRIDPASFRMTLTRWDGTDLSKQRLSAGEKQLLAISVLWAVAKVSGRPVPVVIDTPLARLDRDHRRQLLNEYFPHVSHQVIVLSTDTEVDAAAAQELAPVTVRSFHLHHDAAACQTTINSGYFFPMAEVVNAG